jgi:hypothetical protein
LLVRQRPRPKEYDTAKIKPQVLKSAFAPIRWAWNITLAIMTFGLFPRTKKPTRRA